MHDRYRRAPEALARQQPVAEPVVDRALAAAALLQVGSERDRLLERLSVEREGLEPGDPRLRLAVQLVGTVARLAVEEALTSESPAPFPEILRARLAEARALFAPAAPVTPEEDR